MVASMAKVGKVRSGRSPGVGLDYYVSYVERGGEAGRWLGEAARELGLIDEVSTEALLAAGVGQRPDGSRLVSGHSQRVPAWDVTFTAPKSISVLYGLADDQARQALKDAHDRAVAAAVGWLETHAGRARRGPGGRDGHVPVKLVVAGFVHATSRALDPDLHTHCLVMNLGRDASGRWSSIDSRVLYRHKMAAGAVYRASLRKATTELGLRWRTPDHRGLSELADVPRRMLRAFSTRRIEIEAELAGRGGGGARAAEAAALATRRTKLDVEFAEETVAWRERAAHYGWTKERATALVLDGPPDGTRRQKLRGRTAGRALTAERRDRILAAILGPNGLTKDRAAFDRDDVLRAWAAALPEGAGAADLDRLVEQTLRRPEMVPLVVADETGTAAARQHQPAAGVVRVLAEPAPVDALAQPRYTTTEMLKIERDMLSLAVDGKGRGCAQVASHFVEEAIAGRGLSAEQAAMVRDICGSGDGVSVVIGVPGSGKTRGLGVARELWESAGFRVSGLALAGRAADELGRGAGLQDTRTIDSFLMSGTARRLDRQTVLIVDEAGMVDTRRLAAVIDTVRSGVKIVLVGDDRQLAPIQTGGALHALAARVGAVRMVDNRRQIEAWQRDALAAIRDGRPAEAARAYLDRGRVTVADTPGQLMAVMTADWWDARQAGAAAAMWAYTADSVAELNARGRAYMMAAGRLGDRQVIAPPSIKSRLGERRFAVSDEILCLRNQRRLAGDRSGEGVRNGTLATVIDVHPHTLVVQATDGRTLELPYRYVAEWVDHSYAMSIHKSQGRTIGEPEHGQLARQEGRAFVYAADGLSAEAALVAASRATDATDLYVLGVEAVDSTGHGDLQRVDAHRSLEEAWSVSLAKTAASDVVAEAERVRRLARLPAQDLRTRLAELDLLNDGEARRLREALTEADHRLGVAGAILAETTDSPAADEACNEARTALAESRYLTERLDRHEQLLQAWHSDLRAASAERERLRQALTTQRHDRQHALAADPPQWVTELLGPPPATNDRGRAQLWWEGLSAAIDLRDHRDLADNTLADDRVDVSVWQRSLGLDPDSGEAERWRGAIDAIRRARAMAALPLTHSRALGDNHHALLRHRSLEQARSQVRVRDIN